MSDTRYDIFVQRLESLAQTHGEFDYSDIYNFLGGAEDSLISMADTIVIALIKDIENGEEDEESFAINMQNLSNLLFNRPISA